MVNEAIIRQAQIEAFATIDTKSLNTQQAGQLLQVAPELAHTDITRPLRREVQELQALYEPLYTSIPFTGDVEARGAMIDSYQTTYAPIVGELKEQRQHAKGHEWTPLSNGMQFRHLSGGNESQSNVYLLDMHGEKIVVKLFETDDPEEQEYLPHALSIQAELMIRQRNQNNVVHLLAYSAQEIAMVITPLKGRKIRTAAKKNAANQFSPQDTEYLQLIRVIDENAEVGVALDFLNADNVHWSSQFGWDIADPEWPMENPRQTLISVMATLPYFLKEIADVQNPAVTHGVRNYIDKVVRLAKVYGIDANSVTEIESLFWKKLYTPRY